MKGKIDHRRIQPIEPRPVKHPEPGKLIPDMSMTELARLGGGQLAYIRKLTSVEAEELFPTVKGLVTDADFYVLHAADGTPLMLADSKQAAIGHAKISGLQVESTH
jgi:hypothetical protein